MGDRAVDQKSKIFISYRRTDALHPAGRIRDRILGAYGDAEVFMDIDSIPLGQNFITVLQNKVAECDVLIAVIGASWLTVQDQAGQRRLDNSNDVVRVEVATALKRGIPVIPVLLDGTSYPTLTQLPDDLRELALRHGLEIHGTSFDAGMAKLISELEPIVKRGSLVVETGSPLRKEFRWVVPGSGQNDWFKDRDDGPEMMVVPAGSYRMGSPSDESGREPKDEGPEDLIECAIARPFAVSRFPTTVGGFRRFVEATDYVVEHGATYWSATVGDYKYAKNRSWEDPRFSQDDDHPVVAISWHDACAYVDWLSKQTGRRYRLLSSVEWEYVARAGTTTAFHWGPSISPHQANYDAGIRYPGGQVGTTSIGTVPVKKYEPNAWGIYQMHGNIWEMCSDPWPSEPDFRVCRGGSFTDGPIYLRSAMCSWCEVDGRHVCIGFRVAREL
jgi:formylglycine-generating enzyme required for sulfatase activity